MNYLGFDPGFGNTKVFGRDGGVVIPSLVSADEGRGVGIVSGLRNAYGSTRVSFDGYAFFVGANAHDNGRPLESMDYERLGDTPTNRALLYAALTAYGASGNIMLYTGLPLAPLSVRNTTKTKRTIKRWLIGHHIWQVDGVEYAINIKDIAITPQANGALFDYVLGASGKFIKGRKRMLDNEIGALSVGFNTAESMVIRNLRSVNRLALSDKVGVRRYLEIVASSLPGRYSLGELDALLRSGQLNGHAARQSWASEVKSLIERAWGDTWPRFEIVVLVGGGATVLGDELLDYFEGKAYVPDDPVLAIARGLYKMARLQNGRN